MALLQHTNYFKLHYDDLNALSQLCTVVTRIPSDSAESLELMYKILNRIIELTKEPNHLRSIWTVFHAISRKQGVDLQKLRDFNERIHTLCDSLWSQIDLHNNLSSEQINLFQLNEWIEINAHKCMILRHLSYALHRNNSRNKSNLTQSLQFMSKSIELCIETNKSISKFNKALNDPSTHNDSNEMIDLIQMIETGQIRILHEFDIIPSYHFVSNICQKLNKFEQSLHYMNQAIHIAKDIAHKDFAPRIDTIVDPMSSGDDLSSDEADGSEDEQEVDAIDEDAVDSYQYKMDIELTEDVKQMREIKDKKWNEMNPKQKLFYVTQKQLSSLLLTRGIAHSNLSNYREAFCDAYICTLIHPKNRTAWNNRAFAWYQMGKHQHCISDCTFALHLFSHSKKSQFTRGLLHGNRGLAEYKLKMYHKAVNDLNICLKYATNSRLAREALHGIWKEFTNAIYFGCTKIHNEQNKDGGNGDGIDNLDIPFGIARIIADYSVGIDFEIIQECHESTIVFRE